MMLSDVCLSDVRRLSVAYIGPKSRTEKPRKTKIGTEVTHVTRDSDTTFKVKKSKAKVTGAGAYCDGLLPTACYRQLKFFNFGLPLCEIIVLKSGNITSNFEHRAHKHEFVHFTGHPMLAASRPHSSPVISITCRS